MTYYIILWPISTYADPWYKRIQAAFKKNMDLDGGSTELNAKSLASGVSRLSSEARNHMCVLEPCVFGNCVRNLANALGFNCDCFEGSSGTLCEAGQCTVFTIQPPRNNLNGILIRDSGCSVIDVNLCLLQQETKTSV